jgi:hypothetical protein
MKGGEQLNLTALSSPMICFSKFGVQVAEGFPPTLKMAGHQKGNDE